MEQVQIEDFSLYNGHGDVVQLTDASGSSVKSYDYDAFGNEKNPDANDTNVFRYCGEYFDKETGTIYLRARYYDPMIGRFITEDSYWGKDSDPLGLNLYTYCFNNPINLIDPSGHFVSDWDYAHCTSGEIELLKLYSKKYIVAKAANDTQSMADWHSECENIRNRHRESWEVGTGDGHTKYITFNNTSISAAPRVAVVSFSATLGTGLEAKFKVAGIGVEIGGKRYYDLTNVASNNATESLEFSLMAQASNEILIGGKFTATVDAYTRQNLKNEGFAGVKIGKMTFGWDDLPNNADFTLDFSVGTYIGVGGEASATLNVSELWRRIENYFTN